jgi:macrolide transport system ATP-binding/permease protein
MALIELDRVSRRFTVGDGEVLALDALSLRIEAGEMLAIMGTSGSGKSTLMNLLGCLDKPSSGTLRVDGHDLSTLSSDETARLRRETFGFIFQRYHLLPHLDAVGNVELPAVYAGLSGGQRRERARSLLQRLGLGNRLDHRPHALSGGQQQRVSIARALMNGGRIILADEPTGALDSATGAELLALLRELNAQGHTVILVTHDPAVAAHARRIVELRDGRVVRDEALPGGVPVTHAPAAALPTPAAGSAGRGVGRLAAWREALATSVAVLAGNRLRAALSTLGIAIGIAAVVAVLALGAGLQIKLKQSMEAIGTPALDVSSGHLRLLTGLQSKPFTPNDVAAVRAMPGVAYARLQRSSYLTARYGKRDAQAVMKSMALGDLAREKEEVVQGRDLTALDMASAAPVVLINQKAVEALFPGGPPLGERLMVGEQVFTIVGVTQSRSSMPFSFSQPSLFLPDTSYDRLIDTSREAAAMRIFPAPGLATTVLEAPLRELLLARHAGIEDFTITDNQSFERMSQGLLAGAQAVLAAIAAISLLVGGVGVMNIMLVSVAERTREIGIRMAIGARQGDVRRQFLIESVLVCGLGAVVGLSLPWLAARLLSLTSLDLSLVIGWQAAALALGTSTAIGLLFGNLPADRAARLSPVVALARE